MYSSHHLRALTCLLSGLILAGCGGEETPQDPNPNTDLVPGPGGGVTGPTPVETAFNCNGVSALTCDHSACVINQTYRTTASLCGLSGNSASCVELQNCIASFATCYSGSCPPGTNFADADSAGVMTCSSTYNACVRAATGG